jgi:hypothetical protein
MAACLSLPDPMFTSHLEAAADVVRIGVGYIPPALALLLGDARAGRIVPRTHETVKRMDDVWALVEDAWDRVLPPDGAGLFYEIWSDRFARAAAAAEA